MAPAAPRSPGAPSKGTAAPRRPRAASKGTVLRVVQVRSSIGAKPKHRGTLRALGLRGIGKANELPDRPEIRGMLSRVTHLVSVEEVNR